TTRRRPIRARRPRRTTAPSWKKRCAKRRSVAGDPFARGLQGGGDLFPAHLAREFFAMLCGSPIAASGGDVEPFVRFDQVDATFAPDRAGKAKLETARRHLGSDVRMHLQAHLTASPNFGRRFARLSHVDLRPPDAAER